MMPLRLRICLRLLVPVLALQVGGPAGAQSFGDPPLAAGNALAPRIEWRLENPFRFFTDPVDTELHRATYEGLDEVERRNPILGAEQALARRHPDGWAASLRGKVCWDPRRNLHACSSADDYINPSNHGIVAQLSGVPDIDTIDCTWRSAPRDSRNHRPRQLTVPCDTRVSFKIPYPAGSILSVSIGGQPVAESTVHVKDLLIVGIGDSYGSGEGNPDIPVRFSRERSADYGLPSAGTSLLGYPARVGSWQQIGDAKFIEQNAKWLDQACHRSLYSHQLRAALQLAIENPRRAVTYVGLSCSGAETTFGLFLHYNGNEWVPNPPQLSQISAAAEAQCGGTRAPLVDLPEAYHLRNKLPELSGLILKKCNSGNARRIDLLFLSVGGNDVGFARLVANAVLSDQSILRQLGGWIGQVHGAEQAGAGLRKLSTRYKSLNRALHNILHIPWAEPGRIILSAYPRMAVMHDGKSSCPDGPAGMTVAPELSLDAAKTAEAGAVAERLNTIMAAAAKTHRWTFADAHRQAFIGRGICAGAGTEGLSLNDELRMPRMVNGVWTPYNPADWQPYQPRLRWFRTPNDAYLTGHFHVSASLMQKVLKFDSFSWFQLMLASTYSGAFHPTAEGQAAMADVVAAKARQVLRQYSVEGVER